MVKTKLWMPEEGQTYKSRDEIEKKLLDIGWTFEGHSTGFDGGKAIAYDVGVIDGDIWLWVDMVPCEDGVCVTRVRELKSSQKQRDAAR